MNTESMTEIWVYLSAQPLLWLTLTLAVYMLAILLHRKAGGHPAVNPVLISVAVLVSRHGLVLDPSWTHLEVAEQAAPSLDEAAAAYAALEEGHTRGKIVVTV